MSFDNSSFYSKPKVEVIDSPRLEEKGQIDNANTVPRHAEAPPYARYADHDESFAPSSMTDEEVQAQMQPAVVGPPMPALPIIAAVLFAGWLLFKGDA